jgi:hypothetical protein
VKERKKERKKETITQQDAKNPSEVGVIISHVSKPSQLNSTWKLN